MEVAGGDVDLTEEGRAQGASEFGTTRVVGVALRKRKWYFEVRPQASLVLFIARSLLSVCRCLYFPY